MRRLYSIALLLFASVSFSQPCFNATDTVGCADFEIKMISCSSESLVRYRYGDGSHTTIFGDTNTSHTYTTPGVYSITQFAGFAVVDSLVKENYIVVLDNPEPSFQASYCENFVVKLNFDDQGYDEYILSYSSGSPNDTVLGAGEKIITFSSNTPVQVTAKGLYYEATCTNTITRTVYPFEKLEQASIVSSVLTTPTWMISLMSDSRFTNILYSGPIDNYYTDSVIVDTNTFASAATIDTLTNRDWQFHIKTSDACTAVLHSDSIGSVILNGNNENEHIILNWESYEGDNLNAFHLVRDGIDTLYTGLDTTYIDSAISCGVTYSYEIHADILHTNPNGFPPTCLSNQIQLAAKSTNTPPPLNWSIVSFDEIGNEITSWSYPEESIGSLMEVKNPEGQSSTTLDSIHLPNFSSPFILQYIDICGNESTILDTLTPITLSSTATGPYVLDFHRTTYLSTTSEESSCQLLVLANNYSVLDSETFDTTELIGITGPYPESQLIYTTVECILSNGIATRSNYIAIHQTAQMRMPNAFSPNGDLLNDTFEPTTLFINSYTLRIFDVAGTLIYSGDGWEGPEANAEGIYLYEITGTDQEGNSIDKKGSITIINAD